MKTISLTQGYVAKVDDSDYDWLNQYTWCVKRHKNSLYALTSINRKLVLMHHLIMGCRNEVDHKDLDGLNNQRSNLRFATKTQNRANQRKQAGTYSSKYKGVCWHKKGKKWAASITYANQAIHLGLFKYEVEAAKAYDRAARYYFGEFARTNF